MKTLVDTIWGMKVVINNDMPLFPRVEIDPEFEWITPQARQQINQELAERFGYKDQFMVFDNSILGVAGPGGSGKTIMMSPQCHQQVMALAESFNHYREPSL